LQSQTPAYFNGLCVARNLKLTTPSMSLDNRTTYLCQRCGNCCRWPGDVIVTDEEIDAIAAHLGMAVEEFIQRFTRLSENRQHLSLIEKEDGSCFFLEGQNVCHIQRVKPDQCRGFPNRWRFDGWREICEAVEVRGER
jgi:Fe-S-cluster containining protein